MGLCVCVCVACKMQLPFAVRFPVLLPLDFHQFSLIVLWQRLIVARCSRIENPLIPFVFFSIFTWRWPYARADGRSTRIQLLSRWFFDRMTNGYMNYQKQKQIKRKNNQFSSMHFSCRASTHKRGVRRNSWWIKTDPSHSAEAPKHQNHAKNWQKCVCECVRVYVLRWSDRKRVCGV